MARRNVSCALFVSFFVLFSGTPLVAQDAAAVAAVHAPSIEGVAVSVVSPDGEVRRSVTNAAGQFSFPLESAGEYDLLFFPDAALPAGAAHADDAATLKSSSSHAGGETWYSIAGWPYRLSVGALRTKLDVPVVSEASIAPGQPPVPAIRMHLVVAADAKRPSAVTLRGRLVSSTQETAVLSPEPPKFCKVKVVKDGNTAGCKGGVWLSNGAGKWENNCARGESCCDLSARYDTRSRELAKSE